MTKIKILGNHIIFDGHADTKHECETITLMCDNLAKSIDFKTIKYESGYAEFERIGGTNDLMFAPAGTNYTMVFDSHITKVSATDSYSQTFEWTTSGQTTDGSYAFNGTAQVFTVTLQDGYVIDTVTSDEEGSSISVAADGMSFTTSLLGDSSSGGTVTVTITSKQGGATKQTIDVSTLSGWEALASGDHSITVKTKASGHTDSASSNAVSVSKAASGDTITVNYSSYSSQPGHIYDGQNTSATSYEINQGANEITIQSGYAYVEGEDPDGSVWVGYFGSEPTVSGNVSIENWDRSANNYGGSALFKVNGTGVINIEFECFVEGTLITLADGSVKPVEDIDYTDDILVWDFDNGVQSSAKPCWIAQSKVASCYWEITLSDGTILKLVGANGKAHRLFNSRGKFVYPQDFENNEQTVKQDGSTPYIVKCEKVYKEVRYYNFATNHALNNYANGVLCGCRFSNVYPIENMKYVKDDRILAAREEYSEIPDELFYGLRLAEQQNLDDSPDNVNYFHTMKEHVIHNYIEHERDYTGKSDYETWLFKKNK